MKEVPITRGYVVIVDDEDYEWAMQFSWQAHPNRHAVYAQTSIKIPRTRRSKTVQMHRALLDAPVGMQVDHVDGNGLNNTRANLRLATASQNAHNSRVQMRAKSAPGFKGVSFCNTRKKWLVHIVHNLKPIYVGIFTNPIDAARAYNTKAAELFGEFARLNRIPQNEAA